jgi:hypothetical protein
MDSMPVPGFPWDAASREKATAYKAAIHAAERGYP